MEESLLSWMLSSSSRFVSSNSLLSSFELSMKDFPAVSASVFSNCNRSTSARILLNSDSYLSIFFFIRMPFSPRGYSLALSFMMLSEDGLLLNPCTDNEAIWTSFSFKSNCEFTNLALTSLSSSCRSPPDGLGKLLLFSLHALSASSLILCSRARTLMPNVSFSLETAFNLAESPLVRHSLSVARREYSATRFSIVSLLFLFCDSTSVENCLKSSLIASYLILDSANLAERAFDSLLSRKDSRSWPPKVIRVSCSASLSSTKASTLVSLDSR
mmetsp:Transcript_8064/g.8097  ORF Transcript_8064/g.8097 Transcript_8064/m.8097 type:complete len:272 (-) Transcript_8064:437-1252(-)